MPVSSSKSMARRVAIAATVGAGIVAAAPSAASAAGTNACDASALQLTLLGSGSIDPVHANTGATPCVTDSKSLLSVTPPLLGIVGADVVESTTTNTPNVSAVASSRVVGASIDAGFVVDAVVDPLLAPGGSVISQLNAALAPLNTLLAPVLAPLSGLTGGLVLDSVDLNVILGGVTGTLRSTLETALPDVLNAGVIEANAAATCAAGVPGLSGSSRVADLKVLGTAVGVDPAVNSVLPVDTRRINLGDLITVDDVLRGVTVETDGVVGGLIGVLAGFPPSGSISLYDLVNDPGGLLGLVDGVLTTAGLPSIGSVVGGLTSTVVQPLLNNTTIELPEQLVNVTLASNTQTVAGDQLTQQALTLSVSALGQSVLTGTLAEARVGAGAPGCVPPVGPPPVDPPKQPQPEQPKSPIQNPDRYSSPEAEVYLQCARRSVDMIDVYGQGGRTYVQGVAEKKYVGKTATIYLAHGKKKVGTVKVGEDGLFSTRVALPPSKIRNTNKARYYAIVDGKKTRALKFARRMATNGLTATTKTVTFRGRVVGPLQRRQQSVSIKQRVGCKSYKTVATVKPDAKGNFTVTIKAPAGEGAVIYRAQTRVGKTTNAKRLSPTFTLPRVVGLR